MLADSSTGGEEEGHHPGKEEVPYEPRYDCLKLLHQCQNQKAPVLCLELSLYHRQRFRRCLLPDQPHTHDASLATIPSPPLYQAYQ